MSRVKEGGVRADGDEDDGNYSITVTVLATATLSLVFVLAFLLLLHVYVRCLLGRQARRRRAAIARFHAEMTTTTQAQATDPPPPASGLEPELIASLPRFSYRRAAVSGPAPDCAVCLSAVEDREMVKVMPNCKHPFHEECIDVWLRSHSTCPLCRAGVEPATAESVAAEPAGCGGGAPEGTMGPCREEGSASAAGRLEGTMGPCREEGSASAAGRLGASLLRMLSRQTSTARPDGDLEAR